MTPDEITRLLLFAWVDLLAAQMKLNRETAIADAARRAILPP